jgi:hypothetical protein
VINKADIRRIVVGSTLAAGVGVAGMIGAATANAGPGVSYDGGSGNPIGFGDTSPTGAQASASNGNRALAISIFKPAKATAEGQRFGNNVFALDGTAGFLDQATNPYPDDHNNNVVAINGTALQHGEWTNMVALGGRVSNRSTGETYPNGQNYVYSGPLATFPIIVPSTVVGVCGQRVTGNQTVFEVTGNITCSS